VTAAELAEELDVSLRTLNRDLDILRETGTPIESDRGRGCGLRLQRNWSLGRLHLAPEEAIDLLLSMAIAERMHSPLLLRHLMPVRRKIVAALSESYQPKICALRKRILVGNPASPAVLASYSEPQTRAFAGLTEAFFNMRCLSMAYEDQKGTITTREAEPQYLFLSIPVWYLLAYDKLRGAIRHFRIDRIRTTQPLTAGFRPADPKPYLEDVESSLDGI
jgi:predicted DNA-binding transcriptional regulator YafY